MTRLDFRKVKNELYHYGTKGKSGRYPLGSGERPYQDYPGMRKNKPRTYNLEKLNYMNTKKEAWEKGSAMYDSQYTEYDQFKDEHPKLAKLLKPLEKYDQKLTDRTIKEYSDQFDSEMKKFEEAGVKLDVRLKQKIEQVGNYNVMFVGKEYYMKDKKGS